MLRQAFNRDRFAQRTYQEIRKYAHTWDMSFLNDYEIYANIIIGGFLIYYTIPILEQHQRVATR